AAYLKPYPALSTCIRGALSVDGRNHIESVASALSTLAGTISDECKLELWAESIAPSKMCAQLHGSTTFAIETRASARGAQGGGVNSGIVSGAPRYVQILPPHCLTGYAVCLMFAFIRSALGS